MIPTILKPPFPVLVAGGPLGNDTLLMGCNGCGHTWMARDVDESIRIADHGSCERCGSWQCFYAYDFGSACKGCGALAYEHPKALNGCCSRVCMLQAEYKAELDARKSA